jgi:hypothetical protein
VTTATVSLRELSDQEFADFLDRNVATFAAAIGPARDLTPGAAMADARRDTDRLLPDNLYTSLGYTVLSQQMRKIL